MMRRCAARVAGRAPPQQRWRSNPSGQLPSHHKEHNFLFPTLLTGGIVGVGFLWVLKGELNSGDDAMVPFDVMNLRSGLEELFRTHPEYAPMAVKLVWNANGAFDCKRSAFDRNGATGTVDTASKPFSAMAGLVEALEAVKGEEPISTNDLTVLAAYVGIQFMGGPEIAFKYGREDKSAPPADLDAQLKTDVRDLATLRKYFYKQGLHDQELVALMGAHAMGRCRAGVSGVEGSWCQGPPKSKPLFGAAPPPPRPRWSNEYFQKLVNTEWVAAPCGNYFYNKDDKTQISLPVDQLLLEDKMFRYWVDCYAKDGVLFADHFTSAFKRVAEQAHAPWGPVPY
eukprot:TRINITY_DN27255_c0_g1_i1.p2 TRINITY_DN27255_c0_g1~~TRINITY_DN27255_c0_g1_i1.p2  ORF type:complete len:340 (+),score=109.85 TRINITY_DN27255_c0_g1_i1:70-1089(+)